jgi:hypothetical protein
MDWFKPVGSEKLHKKYTFLDFFFLLVYKVNLFGIVTCVAEFVGGGVVPWFRVDAVKLFANLDASGILTVIAEMLFVFSSFYYLVAVIVTFKEVRDFLSRL